MENGYLDDMEVHILNELAAFVRDKQGNKLPVSRSGVLTAMAVEREADWLATLDLPIPRARPPRVWKSRSPRVYASMPSQADSPRWAATSSSKEAGQAARESDDLFDMDDHLALPSSVASLDTRPVSAATSVKPTSIPWGSTATGTNKK